MRDVLRAVFLYFLYLGWQDFRANCAKLKLLGKKKNRCFRSVSFGFKKLHLMLRHVMWHLCACWAIITPSQKLVRGASFISCSRLRVLFVHSFLFISGSSGRISCGFTYFCNIVLEKMKSCEFQRDVPLSFCSFVELLKKWKAARKVGEISGCLNVN